MLASVDAWVNSTSHWRAALPGANETSSSEDQSCQGSFVSLVSGSRYINAALCLHRSMVAVNSACAFVLVHDDRPEMALQSSELTRLAASFGENNLVPITSLFSQLPSYEHKIRLNYTRWTSFNFTKKRDIPTPTRPRSGRPLHGRRLYTGSNSAAELFVTHLKLWLFALPYPRVIVLDIDMVLAVNIDFLMAIPFQQRVAAVWACEASFNSGLMILKPSLDELRHLLSIAKHSMHLRRACEVKPGDQSILNAHYRHGRWHQLPTSLVTKFKGKSNDTWRRYDPAVLHFSSEPKPWDARAPPATRAMWQAFGCSLGSD